MEKKPKKRSKVPFEPLQCSNNMHYSRQQSTNGCHYVPFGRISQTVTRQADPDGSEASDKPMERGHTEGVLSKRWSDEPWNVRVTRDTFGSESLNTLEKDVPGVTDNCHKKTIDLLLHPSKLRKTKKRAQRDASSQNMNDVTRHIQQLKSKQSLCDSLMENIHHERADGSCEGIKYRLQVLKSSTNVKDKEEKPICPELNQLTSESANFLDRLASTTKGLLRNGMKTVSQSALDRNVLNEPFGQDCKQISDLLGKNQSRPLDNWNSEKTDDTDLPDSRIILADSVLNNFKDHTAGEGFSCYGNDTSSRNHIRRHDNDSSFFSEPGISWTSPIMSSTPKEQWPADSPQEAYKAPNYLDMASLWSDDTSTATEYSIGHVPFLDQQQLWTADFGFLNSSHNKPNYQMPLANLADPDQCSPKCNGTCCQSPVKASEHLSISANDATFQRNPFNTPSYTGQDDTFLHPVEIDLPTYWLKHSSNILEE